MVNIPIVLASDKNGIFQMYTTILSAIENKNNDTFYEFYCLIPSKFSKFVNKKFYKLTQKYKNVSIKFIKMGASFSNIKMQIAHITSPTFYRLKIAELLPNRDKAIYLDIDTIVLADLKELYNIELKDNYIGGIPSASFALDTNNKTYYEKIGLNNMDSYINAGIILWNLKEIRKNKLTEKFLELAKNTYKFMDQDIINLACKGKIKCLNFKFNVMNSYQKNFLSDPDLAKKLYEFYGKEEFESGVKNPVIVHYASNKKPWIDKTIWLSEYWLKYQKKCPFKNKETVIKKYETLFLNQIKENKSKKIMFWGASLFLEDLILSKKIKKQKILGIIDKNTAKQGQKLGNFEIYSPEILDKIKPDIIIFSILHNHNKIYAEVKKFVNENYPKVKMLPCAFEN